MIVLSVTFTVKPERVEAFRAAVLGQAAQSLANETGCLRFDVSTDPEDETRFLLYEIYTDEAAVTAHRETGYYADFRGTVDPWTKKREVATWTLIGPDAIDPPPSERG
jgi:quinol monooxygenase YgiN